MKNHCHENPKTNNINILHFCSIYLRKVSVTALFRGIFPARFYSMHIHVVELFHPEQ
jgi:hypothetical protein